MIKLEMLRVFLAVAEEGALALAAQKLGRTPSALSMALSQLEAQVGAPLFETDRKIASPLWDVWCWRRRGAPPIPIPAVSMP